MVFAMASFELPPSLPVIQPAHLEGDASLATEILPGPPPLSVAVNQPKRDPKKLAAPLSYLPATDPGSTYGTGGYFTSHPSSSHAAMSLDATAADGSRRKRARVDKPRAQHASDRTTVTGVSGNGPAATASTSAGDALDRTKVSGIPPLRMPPQQSEPAAAVPLVSNVTRASSSTSSSSAPLALNPSDSPGAPMDVDGQDPVSSALSRANSEPSIGEPINVAGAPPTTRKDRGKGKEREVAIRRGDEILYSTASGHSQKNQDHCSACNWQGALVYCDGCPRAFHLWCLDPPMDASELPEGDLKWLCRCCSKTATGQNPSSQKPPTMMLPLFQTLNANHEKEFQLPEDIRTFFESVATRPRGNYGITAEVNKTRLNRHGQAEEPDLHRLKDRNGAPILCYGCGKSSLPDNIVLETPYVESLRGRREVDQADYRSPDTPKDMITCGYCGLNWHFDCLDPPLTCLPPWDKKWMCPNHVDHVLPPRNRVPRNAPPIEVTQPNKRNNGNIEIIPSDTSSSQRSKVVVDEVLINGRRYRIPERVIVLDFWNKVKSGSGYFKEEEEEESSQPSLHLDSPLSSLSSIAGDVSEEDVPAVSLPPPAVPDERTVAELLCGLRDMMVAKRFSDSSIGTSDSTMLSSVNKETSATPATGSSQTSRATSVKVEPIVPQLSTDQSRFKGVLSQPSSPPQPTVFKANNVDVPTVTAITAVPPSKVRRGRGGKFISASAAPVSISAPVAVTNGHHVQTTVSSPTERIPPPAVTTSESTARKSSLRLREKPAKNYFEPQLDDDGQATLISYQPNVNQRARKRSAKSAFDDAPMSVKKSLSGDKRALDSVPMQIPTPAPAPPPPSYPLASSLPTMATATAPPPTPNPPTPSLKIRLPRLSDLSSSVAHAKPVSTTATYTTHIKVEESPSSLNESVRRSGRRRGPKAHIASEEGSVSTRSRRSASHHPSGDGGISSSGG